jgi:hypothetical protein
MTDSWRFWAWWQVGASLVCLVPIVWAGHAYLAHVYDTVSPFWWAVYVLAFGVLLGPLLILTAAVLVILQRGRPAARVLGVLGGVLATTWYLFGLWTFTFRYPPHWSLYVMNLAACMAAITALIIAIAWGRARETRAVVE